MTSDERQTDPAMGREPSQRREKADHPIRVLTIRQPWASLIALGIKDVENRTWAPTRGWAGPLLIHAGAAVDREAQDDPLVSALLKPSEIADLPRSAVIAAVWSVKAHEEAPDCCASEWAIPGNWHWAQSGVVALDNPVAASGRLGLWTPADELLNEVMRRV